MGPKLKLSYCRRMSDDALTARPAEQGVLIEPDVTDALSDRNAAEYESHSCGDLTFACS